jgi:hypothetical protein
MEQRGGREGKEGSFFALITNSTASGDIRNHPDTHVGTWN